LKPIVLSLFLALSITSISAASPVDWVVGDVVVAAGNGSYQVWHSFNPNVSKPSYTNIATAADGIGGATAGCTFDSAYRLFTTNVASSKVVRFSVDNGHGPISSVTAPNLTQNESVAFDGHGNFYVGYTGTDQSNAGLAEYSHQGTLLNSFLPPTVTLENSGVDWIDVASDGQTIFYTSQGRTIFTYNTSTPNTPSSINADLSMLEGAGMSGKLFAIRILPPGDGSGGVLVADQSNVKLVKASGGVITSVQIFKFDNESNLQALTLDPTNPARFWVGDASTNDLIQFDMSTGATVVTLTTGSGTTLGGVCVDGGFSAAQNFAPPANGLHTKSLTPADNTFSFSTLTQGTFMATLVGLKTSIAVTVHDALVDSSVAASDGTVFSFNPGSPKNVVFRPSLPCDQTFTNSNTCEVFEFEANPPLDPSVISNVEVCPPSGCSAIMNIPNSSPTANPRLLRNLDEDITDGVNTYPLSGTKSNCVYTVNDQKFTQNAQSCGFQSPAKGQTFTKKQGSSIPFKFVAVSGGSCSSSSSTRLGAGTIEPLLMITQLAPLDATGEPTTAPISEPVIVKGNSGGFPVFTFSGNTWQLQVDTSNLQVGNYLATVVDLNNIIPAFGVNFTLR
jgi:hypothetical protein